MRKLKHLSNKLFRFFIVSCNIHSINLELNLSCFFLHFDFVLVNDKGNICYNNNNNMSENESQI